MSCIQREAYSISALLRGIMYVLFCLFHASNHSFPSVTLKLQELKFDAVALFCSPPEALHVTNYVKVSGFFGAAGITTELCD